MRRLRTMTANHALQRTRPVAVVSNPCVPCAGSLSLGRSAKGKPRARAMKPRSHRSVAENASPCFQCAHPASLNPRTLTHPTPSRRLLAACPSVSLSKLRAAVGRDVTEGFLVGASRSNEQ